MCLARATRRTRPPTASSRRSTTRDYAQALAARDVRGRCSAAVAVRAPAVLRHGLLLLRLQQGHHQEPRARPPTYLDYLRREIDLQATCSAASSEVEQLHFGGGTPTFLSDDEMARADGACCAAAFQLRRPRASIRSRSTRAPIPPETRGTPAPSSASTACQLGVQDFDPEVQQAVNRVQSSRRDAGRSSTPRARPASARSTST